MKIKSKLNKNDELLPFCHFTRVFEASYGNKIYVEALPL